MRINSESLKSQYHNNDNDTLRKIVSSRDYSEDARQAACELLAERGLEPPPLAEPIAASQPLSTRTRLLLLSVPLIILAAAGAWVRHRQHKQTVAELSSLSSRAREERRRAELRDLDPATSALAELAARGDVTIEVGGDGQLTARREDGRRVDVPVAGTASRDQHDPDGMWEFTCSMEVAECLRAGVAYERGDGVPPDMSQALRYYDRACGGGVGEACVAASRIREVSLDESEQDSP